MALDQDSAQARKVLPRQRFDAHFCAFGARFAGPSAKSRAPPGGQYREINMAHIPYVPEDDAKGLLDDLYESHRSEHGVVDNILRIHSLNPRSLKDHVQLYAHLMRGRSPLTRVQREMIAVTVSAENDCYY